MKKKQVKTIENQERVNLKISPQILLKAKEVIDELNQYYDKFEKKEQNELSKIEQFKRKKAFKAIGITEKLSLKTFTESAILYAVKHKIDPRFYTDESISGAINRLRNHLLGFIVMQENMLIRPFQNEINLLKIEINSLKKSADLGNTTIEETALETQATLMGLVYILFEMLQIDAKEQQKLEALLQNKGIEYLRKVQAP
jgi:hypothetical protein